MLKHFFYNRGEVLSDQFDPFKLILFWVPECSFYKNSKKTKNVPKVLKCKINHNFFTGMDFFFADVPYGKGDSFKSANEMV